MFVKSGCILYFIFGVLPLALRMKIVLLFLIEEYKKSPQGAGFSMQFCVSSL